MSCRAVAGSGKVGPRKSINSTSCVTTFTSGGFHRTLQRVRLVNRGRLLLRTPGPVPFGTCICSDVETILSWTCHFYGPFESRTSLGTSILLQLIVLQLCNRSFWWCLRVMGVIYSLYCRILTFLMSLFSRDIHPKYT